MIGLWVCEHSLSWSLPVVEDWSWSEFVLSNETEGRVLQVRPSQEGKSTYSLDP